MNKTIDCVANLLMYEGPSIVEIIENAITEKSEYFVEKKDGLIQLVVDSIIPYNVNVRDVYFYNENNELIKQILIINNEEKIIFDKYLEAKELLKSISNVKSVA